MQKLFENKLLLLILITIIIFTIMGFSYNARGSFNWTGDPVSLLISPVQSVSSRTAQKANSFFYYFRDVDEMMAQNDKLKRKVDELTEQNRKLQEFKQQNEELREALNLKNVYDDYDPLAANIIAKDLGNWFNAFRIDLGIKDGISADYPVRTSKGLVGRVESSDLISSKVMTIVDPGNTVSAKVSKNGAYVLIRGNMELKDRGLCLMDYIDPDADIAVDDIVETSGLGGIYPKGIVIGKVKQIKKSGNDFSKYAVVEPAVDFKKLDQVIVLKARTKPN